MRMSNLTGGPDWPCSFAVESVNGPLFGDALMSALGRKRT